jgi:deoxyribose-phosphate aldolase
MGSGWAGPKHFRIGASGLLDALLATLEGTETPDDDEDY